MNEAVLSVLKSHFGSDKVFEDSTHIIDDLGGDEFDVVDIVVQIEEKLDKDEFINAYKKANTNLITVEKNFNNLERPNSVWARIISR